MRRLAERTLRDRIIKRRLPAVFGSHAIYMSSAGGLKMLLKPVNKIDPDLMRGVQLLVRRGDVVWDIGANVGLFGMAAATRAGSDGKVICFEPDTTLIALLRRNAALFRSAAEITIISAAVAGSTGIRQFNVSARARAENALAGYGNADGGPIRESYAVVTLSIDDCLSWLPVPNVVKIDIEGAEVEILSRKSRLLRQIRPLIFCEINEPNREVIGDILIENDYSMFDAVAQQLSEQSRLKVPTFNTIAIPRECEWSLVG